MLQKGKSFLIFLALFILTAGILYRYNLPSGERTASDTLRISEYQKPSFINPLLTSATVSARLSEIIFDGLIQLDEQFVAQPHLARSWERSENGLTWTFHLRRGVKFHDGVELTAADVAFTFEKIKEFQGATIFAFIFRDVDTVRVKDSYTIQVTLKKPLASFLPTLFMGILPKHLLVGEDLTTTSFNQKPVGTGPFKLKSWSATEILLEANSAYFLGRPYLDQISVMVYPNQEAAWAKLMAGEVDLFHLLIPSNYEIVKQIPSFNFYSVPMPFYYILAFNLKNALFSDPRIRRALNYAINKEEIVQGVLKGQGRIAAGTIFPDSWAYNQNAKPYPYDPHRAFALLKELGWEDHDGDHFLDKDGKPFEFTVHVNSGNDLKEKALLLIQQQLLDIGIKMHIIPFDITDIDFLFKGNFNAHFPEIMARGDPDFNYLYWHSSQIKGGFNVSSYYNSRVDQLLEEGRTELDQERRKAIYFNFQEELLKDPPGIFLFWTNYLVGVHQRFKGIRVSPVGPFANIREWYVPKGEQRYSASKDLNE